MEFGFSDNCRRCSNAKVKYDDIMLVSQNKVLDLQGKTVFTFPAGSIPPDFFLSSDNSKSASYTYGSLTISDGRKLTELFNPQLMKADGKIFLTYMYYSPKRNAIMQCQNTILRITLLLLPQLTFGVLCDTLSALCG